MQAALVILLTNSDGLAISQGSDGIPNVILSTQRIKTWQFQVLLV